MPKQPSFLHNWVDTDFDNGLVRQSSTGREGQKRIVALDPIYDPKDQQFIYNYRRETTAPFVNAYGSETLKIQKPPKRDRNKSKEPVDPYHHMAVITERIPFRLSDAPQLTYPQSLYVLDRSLQGYQVAYDRVGPIRVNDRMIGFNNQGFCKVWVNQDFSNNHPSYPRRRLQSTLADTDSYLLNRRITPSQQSDMVHDVVKTVQNYCEEGRFPEPFASRIHQRNISFPEARKILHESIAQGQILVPDRIDLLTNRVRGYRTVVTQQQPIIQQTVVQQPIVQQQIVQQPVVQQQIVQQRVMSPPPPPPRPMVQTVQTVQQPVTGYKFNYIPPDRPYQPQIFASRVGDNLLNRRTF